LEHGRTLCRDAVPRVRVEGNQIIVSVPGMAVFPEVLRRFRNAAFAVRRRDNRARRAEPAKRLGRGRAAGLA
jgi:hypothetical protein